MKKFSFLFLFALLFCFLAVGCGEKEDVTYTVTFNSALGTAVESQVVKENECAVEPADPTREEHIFAGWFLNDEEYDFATPVTSNITLVAKWTQEEMFVVKFFGGIEGDVLIEEQRVKKGADAVEPAQDKITVVEGYTFKKWNGSFTNVQSDLNITAKYEQNAYTVKFYVFGAQYGDDFIAFHGEPITPPLHTSYDGYEFKGWDKELELLEVTSDLEVNAIYEAIEYDVKYMAGNIELTALSGKYTIAHEEALPSLSGYGITFEGWYTDPTFAADTVITTLNGATGNKVLYAKMSGSFTEITVDPTLADVPAGSEYQHTDGNTYIMGIGVASNIAQAVSAPYAEGTTLVVNVPAGTYEEDFRLFASNIIIKGPNAEVAGNGERAAEAIVKGTVTLTSDIDNVTIQGLRFEGNAQIIGEKGTESGKAVSPAKNHENFVFKNNVVFVELALEAQGSGFMVLIEVANNYSVNTQILNNVFEMTGTPNVKNMIWMDNNEDLKVKDNVFKNVPVTAFFVNDTSKGCSGFDVQFTGNTFDNIGGSGIWLNWVSPKYGSTTSVYHIDNNTFSNVGTVEADRAIYFGTINNNDVIPTFSISHNTFADCTNFIEVKRCHTDGQAVLDGNTFLTAPEYYYVICKNESTTAGKATKVEVINSLFHEAYEATNFSGDVNLGGGNTLVGAIAVNAAWAEKAAGEEVEADGVVYVMGENAYATIAEAASKEYTDKTTINVLAGTYADSFTIVSSNIRILGPAFSTAGNGERPEEAVITGVITLAAEIDNVTIQGFKFAGDAQVVGVAGAAGTAAATVDNHENFVFANNLVSVDLAAEAKGFIVMNEAGNSYGYNMQLVNNVFEFTGETTAVAMVWVDNTEDLKVKGNTFRNIPVNALFQNDTTKGLSGLDVQITDNVFENIGKTALHINWFSAPEKSTEAVYVFDGNTFNNVAEYAINLVKCNNSDSFTKFSISENTFTGTINTAVKIGRINTTSNFVIVNNTFESVPAAYYFDATNSSNNPAKAKVNENNYFNNGEAILILDGSKFVGDVIYLNDAAEVTYYTVYYASQKELATAFLTDFYAWLVAKGHVNAELLSLEAFLDVEDDDVQLNGKWYDFIGCTGEEAVSGVYTYVSEADLLLPTGGNSTTVNEDFFVTSSEYIAKWGKLIDAISATYNKWNNRVWSQKLGGGYDLAKWVTNVTNANYNSPVKAYEEYLAQFKVVESYNADVHQIKEVPAKEGFVGSWNTQPDGSGETVTELSSTMFIDITLYAVYTPVEAE